MTEFEEIVLQASSYSGYEREKALRGFLELKDPRAIPILLKRLNDWVLEVRSVAETVLNFFLQDDFAEHWVESINLVYHLRVCGRAEHSEWVEKVVGFLVRGHGNLLIAGMFGGERKVSRLCSSLILKHRLMPDFNEQVLGHADPIIRMLVLDETCSEKSPRRKQLLMQSMKDPYRPLRRKAFYEIRKMGCADSFLEALLFDPATSIRELAKKDLKERGINVRTILMRALKEKKSAKFVGLALIGIGEDKSEKDLLLLKSFLSDPIPSVRQRALYACSLVLDRKVKPLIVSALGDEHRGVRKKAMRLAIDLDTYWSTETLLEIVKSSPKSVTACLRISASLGRWDRLAFLFSVAGHPDLSDEGFQIAYQQWDREFNKYFGDPTEAQKILIRSRLSDFPEAAWIESVLKTYD